jgi:hypothetical protein
MWQNGYVQNTRAQKHYKIKVIHKIICKMVLNIKFQFDHLLTNLTCNMKLSIKWGKI